MISLHRISSDPRSPSLSNSTTYLLTILLALTTFAPTATNAVPSTTSSLAPRGYAEIDPLAMFCEIHGHASQMIGTTLYIDGGTFHYDNGTQNVGPNMWLRTIDTSKAFPVSSKSALPIKFLEKPTNALELDMHALWRTPENTLLQLSGVYDTSDLNYPGYTVDTYKSYHDIWSYNPSNNVWHLKLSDPVSTNNPQPVQLRRTRFGFITSVPEGGVGKGFIANGESVGTGKIIDGGMMLTYDFATETWTNTSVPWGYGWNSGNLVHIPVGGKEGILLAFAGQGKNGRGPLTQIEIYDVHTQSWLETQPTSGDGIPASRMFACSVVAPSADGSSYNIYLFGGGTFNLQGFYEDVWVLSVPSFRWFPLYTGAGGPHAPLPREAMSCNIVGKGKRTMMVYGGRYRPKFSRPCDETGLFALDMSTGKWLERYDPETKPYEVPEVVSKYIGGGPLGGATKGPVGGFVDPVLEEYFKPLMTKPSGTSGGGAKPSSTGGSSGAQGNPDDGETKGGQNSSSGSSSGSSSDKSPFPIGAIIAIVIGCICLLLLVFGGLYFRRRLNKQSQSKSQSQSAHTRPTSKPIDIKLFPLDPLSSSCQELSTPHYDSQEMPVMGFPGDYGAAAELRAKADEPDPHELEAGGEFSGAHELHDVYVGKVVAREQV